jgi:hypothetical protein
MPTSEGHEEHRVSIKAIARRLKISKKWDKRPSTAITHQWHQAGEYQWQRQRRRILMKRNKIFGPGNVVS